MKNAKFIPLKVLAVLLLSASSFARFSNGNRALRNGYLLDSTQHDGLYDQSILNLYNSHRNVKGVAQEDFYAPIYFRNLKNNIGNNLYGTCNFVAMGMLLSFWDTYWDDSIIPEQYEMPPMFFDGTLTRDTDSPGIRREFGPIFENLPNGYADFANLRSNQWILDNFFQIKLIDMWDSYIEDLNDSDLTMSARNMCRFLFDYLRSGPGFNRSDFTIDYDTVSYSGESELREAIIENVTNGIPVLVGIGHTSDDDYGSHTAIAYDYDEEKDEIYFNMGWGNNASHVTMETFGYSSINNILSIRFNTEHEHTDNYKQFYFGGFNSLCSCEYSKPFDFKQVNILEGGQEVTRFEWGSLNLERWHYYHVEPPKFRFSILYRRDFYIVPEIETGQKHYALTFNQKNSLDQCSYAQAKVSLVDDPCFYSPDSQSILDINRSIEVQTSFLVDLSSPSSNDQYSVDIDQGVVELTSVDPILRVDFESDDILLNFSYWDVQWRNIELSRATDDALFDDQFGYEIINLDNENSLPYLMTYNEDDEKYFLEFYKEVHKIRFAQSDEHANDDQALVWSRLPVSGYEIPYDESLWNNDSVQDYTRCYSYAVNNQIDPGSPSSLWDNGNIYNPQCPGSYAFGGHYYEPGSFSGFVEGIRNYMWYDYNSLNAAFPDKNFIFQPIRRFDVCPEGTYKIALVYYCELTEGIEHSGFHWYRQNPDGTWSHKSGQMPISSMDYGDCEGVRHVITDPLVCNRVCRDDGEYFDYNMFGGYYAVSSWDGIYMPCGD